MFSGELTREDVILQAHLNDLADRCGRNCTVQCSRFLDERQGYLAEQWFGRRGDCKVMLWGGYESAQRRMFAVFPEWAEPAAEEIPLVCLTFRFRGGDSPTHRDFLGAFMSCGIQRETVGDIIVGDGVAQVFVTKAVAPLLRELSKVGRWGVKVRDDEAFSMECKQNFREISGTVASLRIDTVAALAIHESREKTVRLLQQGRIEVNYSEVTAPSHVIEEGDIFVVRGSGKFRMKSVTGLSKKGRLHILIEQYH